MTVTSFLSNATPSDSGIAGADAAPAAGADVGAGAGAGAVVGVGAVLLDAVLVGSDGLSEENACLILSMTVIVVRVGVGI